MVFREGRYQRNHAEAIGRIKRERGEKETSNRIGLHQHQAVMLPLVSLTTPTQTAVHIGGFDQRCSILRTACCWCVRQFGC